MKTKPIYKAAQFALAAAVAAALSAPLHAEPEKPEYDEVGPTFRKLDTNRDGYLSRAEGGALRDFSRVFSEADADRDGRLTPDEFQKAQTRYELLRARAYIDDSVITARVKAALVKDSEVDALAVSVETDKGTVLLSGFVDNERQARRALEIAKSVEGVKNVKSNLVVKG